MLKKILCLSLVTKKPEKGGQNSAFFNISNERHFSKKKKLKTITFLKRKLPKLHKKDLANFACDDNTFFFK